MAKLHAKDDVSPPVSKAAVEDLAHISFSAAHPVPASVSERNHMDTTDNVYLPNGPEVDAMNDPYCLDGGTPGTSVDMDTKRGETPSGHETGASSVAGSNVILEPNLLPITAPESSAPTLSVEGTTPVPPPTKQTELEKVRSKMPTPAVEKRGPERSSKTSGHALVEYNPKTIVGAPEGGVVGSTSRAEVGIADAEKSPKKKKKTVSSPTKVNGRGGVGTGAGSEVRGCPKRDSLGAMQEVQSLKMVIFNIHSTLLDCSLKVERNLNTRIRSIVQTRSRRVVFRPGLIPFLYRCFIKFTVAFWRIKVIPTCKKLYLQFYHP
jgi:hypothetical protein